MKIHFKKILFILLFIGVAYQSTTLGDKNMTKKLTPAMVTSEIFEKARENKNWKIAFATAKNAQIVLMNVDSNTNPKNEIGLETHPFDQVIIIANGNGTAILDGKSSSVKTGDMIFIPQGTPHNVINLNQDKALKVISIYSDTDIPAAAVFPKKSDETQH